jgi:DNA (cytosine-5)-methyltransferase 1
VKGIELFCGLGAFSLAAKKVLPDYECVLAVDLEKSAVAAFKEIHKCENVKCEDANTVEIPKADIIFAGIPCQAFSITAIFKKKAEEDERRHLWKAVIKAAKLSNATYILIEQVPGFSHSENFLVEMSKALWGFGFIYHIPMYLNSVDFGVPQRRKRFYCISSKIPLHQKQMKKKSKVSQKDLNVEIQKLVYKQWKGDIKFNARNKVVAYNEPALTVLHEHSALHKNYTHLGEGILRLYDLPQDFDGIYAPTNKGLAQLMGHLEYEDYAEARIEGLPVYEKFPTLSGNSLVPQCAEFMLSQIFK